MSELLLAQSVKFTNWMTPVWILSVGVALGFVIVMLLPIKLWIHSKIPGINSIALNRGRHIVFGVVLTLVYLALAVAGYWWINDGFVFGEESTLFLIFALPVSALLGFAAWVMMTPRGKDEVMGMIREGFLKWVNYVCIAMLIFAVGGFALSYLKLVRFVDEPLVTLNSATRLVYAGTFDSAYELAPDEDAKIGEKIDLPFYGQEVRWIEFESDQLLEVAVEPIDETLGPSKIFNVPATSATTPVRFIRRADGEGRIPNGKIDGLYVLNLGKNPANVKIRYRNDPVYSQVWIIPWAAALVVLTYLAYLSLAVLFPKIFAIAMSTFKTEISQPLFYILLLIGGLFVVGSIYVPYNTFGEDIKMYKDSGLTLIRVLAIFMAIWGASKSVAEEIEGRTALTVLSKPVGRRQFILGKFSGISLAVGILFILLGLWFVIWTAYKPIYDGVETSKGTIEWEIGFVDAMGIIPAVFLAFLEVVIFVAISVAISTRFGILANFLICFAIYVLGHLTPLIVQSSVGEFEIVHTFGNLIAIIFPVLNHFDVQAAINTNRDIPLTYVGWSVIYCTLYGTIAMLLALVLFEDRDLA